jgi:perosamine synthetase
MSIFNDIPPTAGLPLSARELAAAYCNRHAGGLLAQDFQQYLRAAYAAITCSGTSALYIICEALKELSQKRTILVPAFICPLVAFAIRRAGFFIELYDIGPHDFNGDAAQFAAACAANPDSAAILINHLGGIPCDLTRFEQTIRGCGLFVIEDCAQSFGALQKGKPVGTLGDFSFFSLAAGKGLTLYEGGVLVANRNEHAALMDAKLRQLVQFDFRMEARRILELLGYGLFYRPLLFWFVFTLPQLYWSRRGDDIKALREDFDSDFPVHAVSAFRMEVGHEAFPRIAGAIASQRAKAACYSQALKNVPGISIMQEAAGDAATYPYVIVLFDQPEKKLQTLKAFAGTGLGISQIYARALADYGYMQGIVPNRNSENARRLAARAITLSTNTYIEKNDIDKCIEIIHNVCSF